MKIKEIQAGVKIANNYNSYQASLTADLDKDEDAEQTGAILIERAMEIVQKKINNSKISGEKEVGAAWFSNNLKNNLSVQYSKQGKFEDVEISDLEKVNDGYRQKTGKGSFIFKKIPDEKRKNNKMPVFRVYEVVE